MLSNFIIFRIYLLFAIIILSPICYFITLELFNQILYYVIIFKNKRIVQQKFAIFEDVHFLVNYLLKRQQWFKCIVMLQFYEFYNGYDNNKLLAICFHNLSYNSIARYYYLKALNKENSLELLQNLALVCRDLKDDKMFNDVINKIKIIDPDNDILLKLT